MPCYKPLTGWQTVSKNSKGKTEIYFTEPSEFATVKIQLPCGKCIGCRLERSRQWAMRCHHEISLHQDNCFITLTYADEHIPKNYSLIKRDWQLFLKRLRKKLHPQKIRFFACGEYGDTTLRPHYHAIIFGWTPEEFSDNGIRRLHPVSKNQNDDIIYTSDTLEEIWQKGTCYVGQATFDSAAYVARYILKKINGDLAEEHYKRVNPYTGEIFDVEPEFSLSSRRPGIGKEWYQKYKKDLDKGFITVRGIKMQPAKYYDKLIEQDNPTLYKKLKDLRKEELGKLINKGEMSEKRLKVKEELKHYKMEKYRRNKQ